MRILGIVLIVLGIIGLTYGGITWTRRNKVVDLGPLQVTHEKHETLPLPPVTGAISLVAGLVLVTRGRRVA
jgi:uncharacterized membrane protein YidH (DUF202 family)